MPERVTVRYREQKDGLYSAICAGVWSSVGYPLADLRESAKTELARVLGDEWAMVAYFEVGPHAAIQPTWSATEEFCRIPTETHSGGSDAAA